MHFRVSYLKVLQGDQCWKIQIHHVYHASILQNQNKHQHLPCGEYILKWMGTFEMALVFPVMRSVSSAISFLTAAAIIWKFKNSPTIHIQQIYKNRKSSSITNAI